MADGLALEAEILGDRLALQTEMVGEVLVSEIKAGMVVKELPLVLKAGIMRDESALEAEMTDGGL